MRRALSAPSPASPLRKQALAERAIPILVHGPTWKRPEREQLPGAKPRFYAQHGVRTGHGARPDEPNQAAGRSCSPGAPRLAGKKTPRSPADGRKHEPEFWVGKVM